MASTKTESLILEVKDLRTYFDTPEGTAKAVNGISFKIMKGETFALVGESGCGKSVTALSIIQLIPEPQGRNAGGEILLQGQDIIPLTEREKRGLRGNKISMIFQEPMTALNPVLTIGDQITEAIILHQSKNYANAKTIAIEMLNRVRLPLPEKIFDDYPHSLSGGQRQRVMIAMALSCKPLLLIADEPTTALDVTIQEEILALIKELKEELGTATLLITHNLGLVFNNARRVGVMYGGSIVEEASTKKIFRDPLHPYTLGLMRSVPASSKRGQALETIPGTVPLATNLPIGCKFSTRCNREMIGCKETMPVLTEFNKGHSVACHLYDKDFMAESKAAPIKKPEEKVTKDADALIVPHKDRKVILEVKNLKTYYPIKKGILKRTIGNLKAVDGIDLVIKRGSTLALVGESGCGKTTTGKSILQLIKPTAGEIIFKGKNLSELTGRELKKYQSLMQIIFQDPYSSLNPRIMVGDIIEEGLKSLKPELNEDQRRKEVRRALNMVGLTEKMKQRYPHEFSGGQRQRIGIARALAVEPEFIVCDEATSALDVSVQAQILNLLKSIQRDFGLAFFFITHDLGVVEYIADEVSVMYNGKIVEHGLVDEIFSNPKHAYTKKLLKAVPKIESH